MYITYLFVHTSVCIYIYLYVCVYAYHIYNKIIMFSSGCRHNDFMASHLLGHTDVTFNDELSITITKVVML